MRRSALAMAILAATLVAASPGTYAGFTETKANPASVRTASSFSPVNSTAPSVTGVAALTSTLTRTAGTWVNTNVSPVLTYQWQWCPGGTDCVDIPGETSPSYLITATSLLPILGVITVLPGNAAFRVVETATNTWGSTSASSATVS